MSSNLTASAILCALPPGTWPHEPNKRTVMFNSFTSRRLLPWLLMLSVGVAHLYGAWHMVAHAQGGSGTALSACALPSDAVSDTDPQAGEATHHCSAVNAALATLTPISQAPVWLSVSAVTPRKATTPELNHAAPESHWAHARAPPPNSNTSL